MPTDALTRQNVRTDCNQRCRRRWRYIHFGANGANVYAARIEARHATVLPRYDANPHIGSVDGVSMTVVDRVAVLTGTVDNQRQKELIGGLLKLEPGISSVDNRLIVRPAPSAAAGFAPTSAASVSAN